MANDIKTMLEQNSYLGRGIIIGKTPNAQKAVIAYFIMGRSVNSRNRVFVDKGNELAIVAYDKDKVTDASLIIYSPIRQTGRHIIVTNGDQTDTIYDFLQQGKTFEEALNTRTYEPDYPNFTPRISGLVELACGEFTYKMSILKCTDIDSHRCSRHYYNYDAANGLGHFLHTYKSDGNPLPTFEGDPKVVAIDDDIEKFAKDIWQALNTENKIALCVKYIDLSTQESQIKLYNKHKI